MKLIHTLTLSLLCATACDGTPVCMMGVDPAANPKLAAMCGVLATKKDGGALTVTPPAASSTADGGAADLQQQETAASRDPYEDKPPQKQ
jgi:hypothetical protein